MEISVHTFLLREREECIGKQREERKWSRMMKSLKSRRMTDRDGNKKAVKLMVTEVEAKRRRNRRGESLWCRSELGWLWLLKGMKNGGWKEVFGVYGVQLWRRRWFRGFLELGFWGRRRKGRKGFEGHWGYVFQKCAVVKRGDSREMSMQRP